MTPNVVLVMPSSPSSISAAGSEVDMCDARLDGLRLVDQAAGPRSMKVQAGLPPVRLRGHRGRPRTRPARPGPRRRSTLTMGITASARSM